PSRIHTLPNAWRRIAPALDRDAARRTLGIPREDFVVGWVGRLSVEKGPDVLLEALPHLNTVPLTISLIGGGTSAEQRPLRAAAAARRARAARLRLEREFGVGPWLDRYAGIYRLITRGGGASAPVAARCSCPRSYSRWRPASACTRISVIRPSSTFSASASGL